MRQTVAEAPGAHGSESWAAHDSGRGPRRFCLLAFTWLEPSLCPVHGASVTSTMPVLFPTNPRWCQPSGLPPHFLDPSSLSCISLHSSYRGQIKMIFDSCKEQHLLSPGSCDFASGPAHYANLQKPSCLWAAGGWAREVRVNRNEEARKLLLPKGWF